MNSRRRRQAENIRPYKGTMKSYISIYLVNRYAKWISLLIHKKGEGDYERN